MNPPPPQLLAVYYGGYVHCNWLHNNYCTTLVRASDISRKKKQNFVGFSGANSWKNWPISREKSQNSQKNRPISWDFSGKKANFEGFSGANC